MKMNIEVNVLLFSDVTTLLKQIMWHFRLEQISVLVSLRESHVTTHVTPQCCAVEC